MAFPREGSAERFICNHSVFSADDERIRTIDLYTEAPDFKVVGTGVATREDETEFFIMRTGLSETELIHDEFRNYTEPVGVTLELHLAQGNVETLEVDSFDSGREKAGFELSVYATVDEDFIKRLTQSRGDVAFHLKRGARGYNGVISAEHLKMHTALFDQGCF